ncbi:hypothetical protein TSUD_237670 [Trifolium subterraneum]|uniref:Protein kinase domain-containing protein n=1 Tax=Trifolium subterraneum TaxID=3900 RepID=A0A2Z6M032_TRISU|nr:hypothetical protein TSUD_237670 [Trifolium subterraneum]
MASKNNNRKVFSSDEELSPRTILSLVSETESDNSESSSFMSDSSGNSPPIELVAGGKSGGKDNQMQQQLKSMMGVFKFKSVTKLTAIPILVAASHELTKKGLTKKLARIRSAEECIDIGSIPTKPSWRNFGYAELCAATNDFNPDNLVGKGGHAEVYKGKLADGQVVAVKRLMNDDREFADRAGDFLTELGIIAHINHPNATRLVGFGIDHGLYFVLQLAQHGSLSSLLFVDSDSRQSIVIWAKPLLDSNNVKELADPRMEGKYDPIEMKRAMETASLLWNDRCSGLCVAETEVTGLCFLFKLSRLVN